jgi:hypothetical protein
VKPDRREKDKGPEVELKAVDGFNRPSGTAMPRDKQHQIG